MSIEDRLPPACAFAVSVLQEYELDPESVPEEAVEAAQQHLSTCIRCLSSPPTIASPRKKRKVRRVAEPEYAQTATQVEEPPSPLRPSAEPSRVTVTMAETPPALPVASVERQRPQPEATPPLPTRPVAPEQHLPAVIKNYDNPSECAQCRALLPEYIEAMDKGENVAELYPEVHDHLLLCDSGCLVLLDLFRQEAKATRKYRRRTVVDPFSAIGWELSGFFRTGQIPMHPMALAYGTLILLLLVTSFGAFMGIRWDDARYYHPALHTIPTPDGVGVSDGLHIYDACNASSYQDKRAATQAIQQNNLAQARTLLTQAINAVNTDTTGCNGGEAAIYREDLQVRQSGRSFGVLVVNFDSGPGDANPSGGTDRHVLYAAYTQELVGAYIAQAQYNTAQISKSGAPLLYLVLANNTGQEEGALQTADTIASMATTTDLRQFGLLAKGKAPLLGVLGMAPSSLLQVALPILCHAGVPVISPTATGLFVIDQLMNTSMYRHCAPGFAFIRFSVDDAGQSQTAANYAYTNLNARNAAVFFDPSNRSSDSSAQNFLSTFSQNKGTQIVAQETAVSDGLIDSQGRSEASQSVLLAGLDDALKANPRPDVIFAPMLTNDVITLAKAIAKLPADQQPILLTGGEFVHPASLQELIQWARQQQLTLPHIYVVAVSAPRQPVGDWQKQFYASFCQSFATPGSFCSGTAALDQGALLFADGVEMLNQALNSSTSSNAANQLPARTQLVQAMSQENFAGVSCQISMHLWDDVLVTNTNVQPVILGIQGDGSLQIVG